MVLIIVIFSTALSPLHFRCIQYEHSAKFLFYVPLKKVCYIGLESYDGDDKFNFWGELSLLILVENKYTKIHLFQTKYTTNTYVLIKKKLQLYF